MFKTNDWKKQGTSNYGDETRYTIRDGWFMSYTKSTGEVAVRSPDGKFSILDTDDRVESATEAKRIASNYANKQREFK